MLLWYSVALTFLLNALFGVHRTLFPSFAAIRLPGMVHVPIGDSSPIISAWGLGGHVQRTPSLGASRYPGSTRVSLVEGHRLSEGGGAGPPVFTQFRGCSVTGFSSRQQQVQATDDRGRGVEKYLFLCSLVEGFGRREQLNPPMLIKSLLKME